MARRGDSSVLRLVVIFLRSHARMTQAQFGKESRVDQAQLSRYESGDVAPSEEILRRMAKVAQIDWPLVVHLRQFYGTLLAAAASGNETPVSGELDLKILEPVLLAVAPYLIELQTAEAARIEALAGQGQSGAPQAGGRDAYGETTSLGDS